MKQLTGCGAVEAHGRRSVRGHCPISIDLAEALDCIASVDAFSGCPARGLWLCIYGLRIRWAYDIHLLSAPSLERHDGRTCTKRQRRVARSSLKCGTQADVQARCTLRGVMSIVVTFHSYSVRREW
jgi:hypothetical protein